MKRSVSVLVAIFFILSVTCCSYSADTSDGQKRSSGGNSALTGALMGGLLGGGLGAAIGSASGHAGTGAAIGAGVGALGGTVIGASKDNAASQSDEEYAAEETPAPASTNVKKRIIRKYDDQGNVISEEVAKN